MQAYNTTVEEMQSVALPANVRFKDLAQRGKHVRFTLTVESSRGPHARRSHQGRRIAAACWHAHRDVLAAFFKRFPYRRVKSIQADYQGAAHFRRSFKLSGNQNIGSLDEPLAYRHACDCEQANVA